MRSTNDLIIRTIARAKAVSATRDEGATAVEDGLMVGLIAAAIIVTVTLLGGTLDTLFADVEAAIPDITP